MERRHTDGYGSDACQLYDSMSIIVMVTRFICEVMTKISGQWHRASVHTLSSPIPKLIVTGDSVLLAPSISKFPGAVGDAIAQQVHRLSFVTLMSDLDSGIVR